MNGVPTYFFEKKYEKKKQGLQPCTLFFFPGDQIGVFFGEVFFSDTQSNKTNLVLFPSPFPPSPLHPPPLGAYMI